MLHFNRQGNTHTHQSKKRNIQKQVKVTAVFYNAKQFFSWNLKSVPAVSLDEPGMGEGWLSTRATLYCHCTPGLHVSVFLLLSLVL